MSDVATYQMVEEICAEMVKARKMFTAFDVSREARQRGTTERHRNMKQAVHDYFERGDMGADYDRLLVAIPGVSRKAWLYYLRSDDPALYQPQAVQAARKSRGGNLSGCHVDRRARVCVPVRWVRQAGLHPGDSVYVLPDQSSKCLVLTSRCPTKGSQRSVLTYKVDRDGNIRIAKGTLQRAAITGQVFDIHGDKKKITVRPFQNPQTTGASTPTTSSSLATNPSVP
jgi:hypothetical protein